MSKKAELRRKLLKEGNIRIQIGKADMGLVNTAAKLMQMSLSDFCVTCIKSATSELITTALKLQAERRAEVAPVQEEEK